MDVYLILGGENEESRPRCNAFLEHAKKQAEYNPKFLSETFVVCSGAHSLTSTQSVPESIRMAEYLKAHDIPAKIILTEENSRDTLGNFVYSYPIIMSLKPTRVFLVTESFHMNRGANIFKKIYGDIPLTLVPAHNHSLIFSASRLKFWRSLNELTMGHPDSSTWQRIALQLTSFSRASVVDYFILMAIEWDLVAYNVHDFRSAQKYLQELPIYGNDTHQDSAYAILIRKLLKK